MSTGPSLYDMLLGHIDGVSLDDHDSNTLEIMSVLENLRRILNTRAGTLKHLPNYGLPDLTMVYRNLPASIHQLKAQIEATLLVYEPRIRAIDVEVTPTEPGMMISYEMTCHLKKRGLVRFGTHYEPEGRTRLEWRRTGDRDA
ncbi:type VI secretion system baseplate subunit TssE [Stenotrophobium rhamnosiphilum]|uniref:Type VI secretion system baseplate subunit TssE n=1 Tax=Stenotrophobium rhamnosiphilum TaxID=2029166 RepID=A0A2T5MJY0_9GAMM|nr:type VI secretion system baseplate subunit TssE [Stenotrophobium rhamnosiphilum]PTU32887.1 type VI secretion system baseplate subunit TssE [Stenotrophobium rhamnosiphilum]